jgi:iron complex outermembrane receptor protein
LYVSNHAKFLANFNLSYRFKMLRISANGLYKVRSTQVGTGLVTVSPDYFMMNARAEAILFKENLSLYFQADNVLDKRYSDILGPVMPGRWLSAGIKVSIR